MRTLVVFFVLLVAATAFTLKDKEAKVARKRTLGILGIGTGGIFGSGSQTGYYPSGSQTGYYPSGSQTGLFGGLFETGLNILLGGANAIVGGIKGLANALFGVRTQEEATSVFDGYRKEELCPLCPNLQPPQNGFCANYCWTKYGWRY